MFIARSVRCRGMWRGRVKGGSDGEGGRVAKYRRV